MAGSVITPIVRDNTVIVVEDLHSIAIPIDGGGPVIVPMPSIAAVISPGLSGPPGPIGPKGDPGLSGASYVHEQLVAASVWVITHGLGRYPSVTLIDSAGDPVFGDVRYTNNNEVTVTFASPFTGKAYLN